MSDASPAEPVGPDSPPPAIGTPEAILVSRGRRGPRPWLVIAVGVVAFGVAGSVLLHARYGIPVVEEARPAPRPPGVTAFDNPLAMVTEIRIRVAGAKGGRTLVVAGLPNAPGIDIEKAIQSRLARELYRQAFLISARESLGAVTRDALLGEATPPADGRDISLQLGLSIERHHRTARAAIRGDGPEGPGSILLDDKCPLPYQDQYGVPGTVLIERAEALSRGPFAEVLRRALPPPAGNPTIPPRADALPAEVEGWLSDPTITPQVSALRALHAAEVPGAEQPALIGGLARGYANLGILTESHWGPESFAWKARGLIYAQRLVARRPGGREGLWHRAYALALAGRHGDAIKDLDAAREIKAGAGTAPRWLAAIDAYCRFDRGSLAAIKADPHPLPLAYLLDFLMVEYASQTTRRGDGVITTALILDSGRAATRALPECYRIHDELASTGGVSVRHESTVAGARIFSDRVPKRLASIPGIPATVADATRRRGFGPEVLEALRGAGAPGEDVGEPSWGALGRMLLEAQYLQVFRRAQFMHDLWSVPTEEFLASERKAVASHPLAAVLECYGEGAKADQARDALRDLDVPELGAHQIDLTRLVEAVDKERATRLSNRAFWTGDYSERQLRLQLTEYTLEEGERPLLATRIMVSNPSDPLGMVAELECGWPWAREHAKEWEERADAFPSVLAAIARVYAREGSIGDAIRCLGRAAAGSPDADNLRTLAGLYRKAGDREKWRATLLAILGHEDTNLDHARVQVELAEDHMGRGEWDAALPYAEAAGESWSAWGMDCARRCSEGAGDWRRAEMWARRRAERYPNDAATWMIWCIEKGRGDAVSAARLAQPMFAAAADRVRGDDLTYMAIGGILAHEPGPALRRVASTFPRPGRALDAPILALLADEAGDPAIRGRAWDQPGTDDPSIVAMFAMFRASMATPGGGRGGLDLKAADGLISEAAPGRRGDLAYFIGRFLQLRDRRDEAKGLLRRCVELPETKAWIRFAAEDALQGSH